MSSFCHVPRHNKETRKRPPAQHKKSLIEAYGISVVEDGVQRVVWNHGNMPAELTEREKVEIKRMLGVKSINDPRCLEIKRMAVTMTAPQIVKAAKGRRGWSKSMVTKVLAALSRAKG